MPTLSAWRMYSITWRRFGLERATENSYIGYDGVHIFTVSCLKYIDVDCGLHFSRNIVIVIGTVLDRPVAMLV